MKKSKFKILVTGVGGPAGINFSRILRTAGNIHIVGCDVDELASGQCFVDEFVLSPYVRDVEAYKTWMQQMVATHDFDMVIPTVHEELSVLATFADSLSVPVLLSPVKTLEIGDDKLKAYEWMKNNFKDYTPNFIPLSEWTPLWDSASEFFIKPRVGRGGRGCRVVSRDELIFLKEKSALPADFVVMEVLQGTEWTVDVYIGNRGNVVYVIPRERIGLAGGISIKGRTVHHKELIQKTKELLTKLEVSGPACIQWKADSAGVPRFVEINPRFSGGLMISVAAGVDPVAAIVADIDKVDLDEQSWNETTVVGYLDYQKLESI